MRVAVIGTREIFINNLADYLPPDTTEIVSGGAVGVDTCAATYAKENGIRLTEFLPNYNFYGKAAPLKRNTEIINHSDLVLAFWDGTSHGTRFVIENCKKLGVAVKVYLVTGGKITETTDYIL